MNLNEIERLAMKYNYLPETIKRFIDTFGIDETKKMIEAYEEKPSRTIRTNTLKITSKMLKTRLIEKGYEIQEIDFYKEGFEIRNEPLPLGATTEYLAGYYFIQSKASWIPVLILEPKKDEIVLDLAAAPGGKASHIAELMMNTGTLICVDISRERMKALRSNLSRLGLSNSIYFRMDGRDISEIGSKMDKILLDAPCSGEGLMAVDPSRRKSKNLEDIIRLSKLQKELLAAGLKCLKNKGTLVYSTCSTAVEENEEIIDWALNEFPIKISKTKFTQFSPGIIEYKEKRFDSSIESAIRLYPHKHKTEGFFACKIKLLEEIKV